MIAVTSPVCVFFKGPSTLVCVIPVLFDTPYCNIINDTMRSASLFLLPAAQQHIARQMNTFSRDASSSLLQSLINHEQQGVPTNAGTDTDQGFDLVRSFTLHTSLKPWSTTTAPRPPAAGTDWRPTQGHTCGACGRHQGQGLCLHLHRPHLPGGWVQNRLVHQVCMCVCTTLGGGLLTNPGAHSPHITTLRERIQVDSQQIPHEDWEAIIARHAPAVKQAAKEANGALSHFEVVTALALRHFCNQQVCGILIPCKQKFHHQISTTCVVNRDILMS